MDEDAEFEVTAEMLIHDDVDDEQTLVEAEALETVGEVEEEIADLQQEGELPLEELLKRYGYSFPGEQTVDTAAGERISEEEEGEGEGEGEGEEGEGEEGGETEGGVKRVRVQDQEGVGEKEDDVSSVKRVKVEDELNQATVTTKVLGGDESQQEVAHTERKEVLCKERILENSIGTTGDAGKDGCVHFQSNTDVHVSPSSPVSPGAVPAGVNCWTVTDNSSQNPTHNPTHNPTLSSSSDSPSSSVKSQSTSLLLRPLYSPPLCNRTQPEDISVGTAVDTSCTAGQLSSPTDDSSPFHGELLMGKLLLPDEAGLEGCDGEIGGDSGLIEVSGCREVEGGGGGGRGEGEEVGGGGGGRGGGGGGSEGGRDDRVGVVREERRREVFCADGSGDVLLIGGLVGEGEGEEERSRNTREQETSPRCTDGYSSDHMSSSDTHVHTPSTSSSLSLQASSATSSEGSRTRPSRADIKSRLRPEIPERRSMRLMANDEKALDLYFSAFFDDEEGDEEYLPVEDWKQETRVGSSYQVNVEERPSRQSYPNQTEAPDTLLWRPHSPEEKVVSYLKTVSSVLRPESGNSSWDTEQALQLLQKCEHDAQRALDIVGTEGLPEGTRPWTEEECGDFEQGLRVSGKDFFQLTKKVPSRSVKELVEFYYFWKKSKRYEEFLQHGKIGKKKAPFQPGQVFDFMDNYLNMQDLEATDVHYATTTVYAEHKKDSV